MPFAQRLKPRGTRHDRAGHTKPPPRRHCRRLPCRLVRRAGRGLRWRRVLPPRQHAAVYGAVSERVLVRPAETVYRTIPPVYETVPERVLVAPGGRVWQTRRDAYGELIGCWVDVPPRYAFGIAACSCSPPRPSPRRSRPNTPACAAAFWCSPPARAGFRPITVGRLSRHLRPEPRGRLHSRCLRNHGRELGRHRRRPRLFLGQHLRRLLSIPSDPSDRPGCQRTRGRLIRARTATPLCATRRGAPWVGSRLGSSRRPRRGNRSASRISTIPT